MLNGGRGKTKSSNCTKLSYLVLWWLSLNTLLECRDTKFLSALKLTTVGFCVIFYSDAIWASWRFKLRPNQLDSPHKWANNAEKFPWRHYEDHGLQIGNQSRIIPVFRYLSGRGRTNTCAHISAHVGYTTEWVNALAQRLLDESTTSFGWLYQSISCLSGWLFEVDTGIWAIHSVRNIFLSQNEVIVVYQNNITSVFHSVVTALLSNMKALKQI